jgi:endogenous inhibitor of DNA gyrase (YacG/DUF329 family)
MEKTFSGSSEERILSAIEQAKHSVIRALQQAQPLPTDHAPELQVVDLSDEDMEKILHHISKAKLSILKGQHTGDTTAKLLLDLLQAIREVGDRAIWQCPECGAEASWGSAETAEAGSPVCSRCDIDMLPDRMALFNSEEWIAAEAYALRISNIKKKGAESG